MPYFALFYDVVNDFETKRAAFRQDHLRYARQDPYVVNGLVARWEIRPWTVVIGGTEPPSSALQLG